MRLLLEQKYLPHALSHMREILFQQLLRDRNGIPAEYHSVARSRLFR